MLAAHAPTGRARDGLAPYPRQEQARARRQASIHLLQNRRQSRWYARERALWQLRVASLTQLGPQKLLQAKLLSVLPRNDTKIPFGLRVPADVQMCSGAGSGTSSVGSHSRSIRDLYIRSARAPSNLYPISCFLMDRGDGQARHAQCPLCSHTVFRDFHQHARSGEISMFDIVYIGIGIVAFVMTSFYLSVCDSL